MTTNKDKNTHDEESTVFNLAVEKYEILLKSNVEGDLLNSSAIGFIEGTPESMHNSLMLKFTFLLGFHNGLTSEQIWKVLQT